METSPEPEDCRRLNDSGILIPTAAAAAASPPISPTSPTFQHGHFASAWSTQRILNLEGEALPHLSALYILRELIRLIRDIELLRHGSLSSADSPLYEPTAPSRMQDPRSDSKIPYRPCHYFDLICGSRFGGFSAVMLGIMRLTIDEAIDRYRIILVASNPSVPKVLVSFTPWDRRPKNSKVLRNQLQSVLEEPSRLYDRSRNDGRRSTQLVAQSRWALATMESNEKMCKTIIFTTQESHKGDFHRPYAFRSYRPEDPSERARNAERDTTNIRLVDACQASLSTPTSYDSVSIDKLGKFRAANATTINPAFEAYNEMRDSCRAKVQCLLSIGIDAPVSSQVELTSESQLERVDEQLLKKAKRDRFHVRRFADKPLLQEITSLELQDAIRRTESRVRNYCEESDTKRHMQSWAERLVRYRRLRAETVRWNEYAGFDVSYPEFDKSARLSAWAHKVSATSVL